MSRELKFRYKTPWGLDILTLTDLADFGEECSSIDIEYRGQYTGLKDKNGTDIYEGDIVCIQYDLTIVGFIEFKDGYYTISGSVDFILTSEAIKKDDIEVVGNIYENPELVK